MDALSSKRTLETTAGTAGSSPVGRLVLVVGYDGSGPARRALEEAEEVLRNREGSLEVVYVADLSGDAGLSAPVRPEVLHRCDEKHKALAQDVRGLLMGQDHPWHFQRRDGSVSAELLAVAADLQRQHGDTAKIVIVMGRSAQHIRRVAGSAGSSVVRSDRVPVLLVP